MEAFLEILKSIVYGIIQGITEWLPISSTGHLILAEQFIPFNFSADFFNTFKVVIQFGSIIAVVCLFFHKLNPFSPKKTQVEKRDTFSLWGKVLVACIPAGIVGLLFDDIIDQYLSTPIVIAATLILYGILFILLENRKKKPQINQFSDLSYKVALLIGVCQMLALIPGTSRSGATILGAVFLGCSRYIAAEFSFFVAIPVMLGASGYKLLKTGFAFSGTEWLVLLIGMAVSFIVSLFAIRFLMDFVKKHNFKPFGWYRIALGILLIILFIVGIL